MTIEDQDYKSLTTNWVYLRKLGIVKIDSRIKKYDLETKDQRNQDINSIDYESRINSGWYSLGVAASMGWTIGHEYYAVGIDLDKWDAVKAWFGGSGENDEETWERVLEYAKHSLIEWHNDKTLLHLIVYLREPIKNVIIPLPNDAQIEIRGEGQLLCVSPSIAKDGNSFAAIDNEQIPILDGIQRLGLQAKIHSLFKENSFKDYLSEIENKSISDWLHDPTTVFGVGKGRHNWTVWIVNSYFWKWGGEWLGLSDEQRFERAWRWHLEHCKPPRTKEEFDKVCRDVSRKYIQERDKLHDEKRRERQNVGSMPGCISYQISSNPDKFITGTPWNTVVEIRGSWEKNEDNPQLNKMVEHTIRTFTACKPIRIIKHINPLSFLELRDKYTIEFRGSEQSGCFTTKHKSMSEIIAELNDGNALSEKGIEIMLQAQIKGFEKAGQLEISDSIDYSGFFPSGNKIVSSNVKIPDQFPDVTDALMFIEELETKYYVGREDLLAHTLLWFMIAPFSFLFKVIGAPYLDWMHPHGNPNTGKTTSGEIGLGIDDHDNEDFKLNMRHIDTIARFGDTISDTTFPKIVNEVDLTERDDIINNIITAVDAIKFRKTMDRNRHSEYAPGLTSLFLTGNTKAPSKPEYLKRVRCRFSTANEVHLPNSKEAKAYKIWLANNNKRSHTVGQFRNKFVMEHKDIILDTNLTAFEKSMKIWTAIYESVGRRLPEFFNRKLEENQMQESIEDRISNISNALQAWIVDKCRALDTGSDDNKKILDEYKESSNRLVKLIDRNLIPYVKRDEKGNVVFFSQVINDLEKSYGMKELNLHSLSDSIPNSKYGKLYNGRKVVKCSMDDLMEFFGEVSPIK